MRESNTWQPNIGAGCLARALHVPGRSWPWMNSDRRGQQAVSARWQIDLLTAPVLQGLLSRHLASGSRTAGHRFDAHLVSGRIGAVGVAQHQTRRHATGHQPEPESPDPTGTGPRPAPRRTGSPVRHRVAQHRYRPTARAGSPWGLWSLLCCFEPWRGRPLAQCNSAASPSSPG